MNLSQMLLSHKRKRNGLSADDGGPREFKEVDRWDHGDSTDEDIINFIRIHLISFTYIIVFIRIRIQSCW